MNRIVGEMHGTETVFDRVLVRSSPDIAKFVPVAFDPAVHAGHQHIVPDIELTAKVQERPVEILLYYVCAVATIVQLHPIFED